MNLTSSTGIYKIGNNTIFELDISKNSQFIGRNKSGNPDRTLIIGSGAGTLIGTSSDCTYIGINAGSNNSASNNTFIGSSCGQGTSSGSANTSIGWGSGNFAS